MSDNNTMSFKSTLKIENVEKKQTIWLFYEPTNTSNNYQVKVNSIYVEY